MFKRFFLFLGLNVAIILTISVLCDVLNLSPYLTRYGLDAYALAVFCLLWGFTGSIISLFLSKKIAKWSMNVKVINKSATLSVQEKMIYSLVEKISMQFSLTTMPEVGIFASNQCNAFATGRSKNSSLIAVSTKLLESLSEDEIEAVIAHEMAHIINGDMVTMVMLQGVINSFSMFLARIIAYALTTVGSKDNRRSSSSMMSYYILTILFEIVFLSIGSLLIFYVSRKREFAADKGAALKVGKEKMVNALLALKNSLPINKEEAEKQKALSCSMIKQVKPKGFSHLFSTHPTIDERITYIQNLNPAQEFSYYQNA